MAYLDTTAGPAYALLSATAGTVTASKAVIVDANKDAATFRHVTLSGNLVSGATTLSETDLAKIDAITNGTAAAGKALVADANVMVQGVRTVVQAKATAYTITAADSGTIITNRGAAGSVTITLPTVAAGLNGVNVTIMAVVAAQNVVIAAQTAGQLIAFNDVAADSVTISTTDEIIGAAFQCVCDGTSWLIIPHLWEAQSITIA